MAPVEKATAMEGCGQPGVGLVLPGSDTGCPAVWSKVLGSVGLYYEYGGE